MHEPHSRCTGNGLGLGHPGEDLADAVNAQARLMAGIHPDEFWEEPCKYAVTDHPYISSSTLPSSHSKHTDQYASGLFRRTAFVRE